MDATRPFRSLRLRLALALLVPLAIALTLVFALEYRGQRNLMLENLRLTAANSGAIIESSLRHAMQTNDFTALQEIISDVSHQSEVLTVLLLDKDGTIVLSADQEGVGEQLDASDPTCEVCHQPDTTPLSQSVLLVDAQGRSIFRNVDALENAPGCQSCHDPSEPVLGVLISDFSMESIEAQLTSYGRARLVWSAGAILLTLLAVGIVIDRGIVARVQQLTRAIRRVDEGDLDTRVTPRSRDELGLLADAMNRMVEGLQEKRRLEHDLEEQAATLRAQADRLATLNALATAVGGSLDLSQVLETALDRVLELTRSTAGWVLLWDEERHDLSLAASRGLDGEPLAADQEPWDCALCEHVFRTTEPLISREPYSLTCSIARHYLDQGAAFQICVPLESKERPLGTLGLVSEHGSDCDGSLDPATVAMLSTVGRQIGVAIENASLYEELSRKEILQRQLLERIMTAQEEERRRIARELHDQTGQALSSLIMGLEVTGRSSSVSEIGGHLLELRQMSTEILEQVHDLALELRPSVLDDLGLIAAIRHYLRGYHDRYHLPVEFQMVGAEPGRLPPEAETALYRIMQEALTNAVRHARAQSVSVLLENRGRSVVLIVEDDGEGFDVQHVMGSRLHKGNLGLYGMQERASLVGGTLTVESSPGKGTAVYAEIPFGSEDAHGQDTTADR